MGSKIILQNECFCRDSRLPILLSLFDNLIPVRLPPPPDFPDPNLIWLCKSVSSWDGKLVPDVGFLGIPFDKGVASARRGASLGPKSVRDALYYYTDYCIEHDVSYSSMRMVDLGDVRVDESSFSETHRRVETVLSDLFALRAVILTIGGDHSLGHPIIKAFCKERLKRGQKLGIVDFDSHFDTRSGWKENSGLWAREILELEGEPVKGDNFAQIGVHGYRYSKYYRDQVEKYGIKFYTPLDVRREGMESIVSEALKTASDGTDAIYLSVDIDCLDQTFAPGTNSSYPGGLLPLDLMTGVYSVAKHPLTGAMDLMEVAPGLDVGNLTSRMGAEVLLNFLCGIATRNK